MKVFSVVGNRPQFIKAAPTSVALRERGIDEVVLHTGQHYDRELSQVFFEELGLEEPRYALDLRSADTTAMRGATALAELGLEPGGYLLLTIHREANTEPERLARLAEGIRRLEEPVVFPVHPRTRAALDLARLELGA